MANTNLIEQLTREEATTLEREAAHEIERLRVALEFCEHQTHSLRVWGGQGWSYHPPQVKKIVDMARSTLDAN